MDLSFETISCYGPNGAVIHYQVEKETARDLGTDSLYLLVSHGSRCLNPYLLPFVRQQMWT